MLLNAFSESGIATELRKLKEESYWAIGVTRMECRHIEEYEEIVENCRGFRWNSFGWTA